LLMMEAPVMAKCDRMRSRSCRFEYLTTFQKQLLCRYLLIPNTLCVLQYTSIEIICSFIAPQAASSASGVVNIYDAAEAINSPSAVKPVKSVMNITTRVDSVHFAQFL
jgi:hypothetical protein